MFDIRYFKIECDHEYSALFLDESDAIDYFYVQITDKKYKNVQMFEMKIINGMPFDEQEIMNSDNYNSILAIKVM